MINYIKDIEKQLKELSASFDKWLEKWSERWEAENSLASISSYDFVCALRPVAEKISEQTGRLYCDILTDAKKRVLAGQDIAEILWHFDSQLIR